MERARQMPSVFGLRWSVAGQPLATAGVFSLAMVVPTLALLLADQRVLDHELLWLKPLKFQLSMALLCLTLAAGVLVLSKDLQSSLWIRLPAWSVSVTAVYELIFLAIQAARGKRSHFNSETLFDQISGSLMAAGASVLVGGAIVIGLVILVAWAANGVGALKEPWMLSVGLGFVMGGVLGGYSGSFIGMNAGPFVGVYVPSDPVLPLFGWSQTIGDLRIAHFLGLHAMQALPMITGVALLVVTPQAAIGITIAASGVWVWITLSALYAAQAGVPPFFL